MSLDQGIYTPLPSEESGFRLLTLLPGPFDQEIACNLDIQSLSGDQEFTALSYTWGDAHDLHPIFVNGTCINVTANLKAALQYIRRPSEPRVLWIDAICINQDDNQEKLLQVQRMGRIFSSAAHVIAWLGEPSPGLDKAWSDVVAIGEVISSARGCDEDNFPDTDLAHGRYSPDDLRAEGVDFDAIDWNAIWDLCERPFWHRVWIIQELVLSGNFWGNPSNNRCVLGCGSNWMPLHVFMSFISVFGAARVNPAWIGDLPDATPRTLLAMRGAPAAERMFEIVLGLCLSPANDVGLLRRRSLSHLLRLSRKFHATDSRDKLYAFLGIADNPFVTPDYTLSATDVFKNWIKSCIERDGNLDCLLGNRTSVNQSGPSWVPELSGSAVEGFSFLHEVFRYASSAEEEDKRVYAGVAFLEDGNALEVQGISIGRLEHVAGPFSSRLDPDDAAQLQDLESAKTTKVIQGLTELMKLYLSLPNHTQEEAWRALVMDKDSRNRSQPVSPAPDDFRRLWGILMFVIGATDEIESVSQEDLAAVAPLVVSLDNTLFADRCFFVTEDLVVGLGPYSTQPGDEVVVLFGSPLCFVLRPDSGRYRLVGDAYVQGVSPATLSNSHDSAAYVKDFMIQ
ncbi:hypothetical protein ACHAPT_005372 [Fusarium lateritium]